MLAGILEYISQTIAYALLAAMTVELLLLAWKVQDPSLAIAFRLLVLVIPPIVPLVFAVIAPGRGTEIFRKQIALLDLQNWLGPEPSIFNPIWILLLAAAGATTILLIALHTVGLMRRIRAGGPYGDSSLFKPPPRLAQAVHGLADLGVRLPPVVASSHHGPTAFTAGLRNPTILVSMAMVELLDDEELETVLAHEAAHVSRQDNWLGWLSFVLRVSSFYNPVVQFIYHSIGHDVERVCDDEAGRMTGKPLALASALIKVHLASRAPAAAYAGWRARFGQRAAVLENRARRTLVEDRAERLVHPEVVHPTSYPGLRLALGAAAVLALCYFVV